MQKQDFEKQVQYKLDELSLTPSAPVWQKVEKEIRQKKKRRLLALLLFPLLFMGAAGTYWGLSFSNTSKTRQLSTAPSEGSRTLQKQASEATFHDIKNVSSNTHKKTDNSAVDIENTATITPIEIRTAQTSANISTTVNDDAKNQYGLEKKALVSANKKNLQTFSTERAGQAHSKNKSNTNPILAYEHMAETSLSQPPINNRIQKTRLRYSNRTLVVDAASVRTNPVEIMVTSPLAKSVDIKPATDSTQNKKQEGQKAKWSWAVQASTGLTSLQTDLLSTTATTPALYDNLSNSSVPPPSSSPPPVVSNSKPSEIEKGIAFHVNATIKRNLSRRLSATAGLQYSYFSTKSYVGQSVFKDTLVQLNS